MVRIKDTLFCDGCGVEITCQPVMVGQWAYCCKDCAAGKTCSCASLLEIEEERRSPYPEISV